MDDVAVGITAFNRPRLVERLVASVRARYPALPIIVADNGWQPADLAGWDNVEILDLPRDCGLSAARNALASACPAEYLVLAEEDFVFTDATDLEAARSILEAEPEVGMVGGSLICGGQLQHYARNFRRETHAEGEVLKAYPAGGPMRRTGQVPWRECEMVFNWGMLRRVMVASVGWDEELKLAEHVDYFVRLAADGRWRVVHTPALVARHDREEPPGYSQHRRRAGEYLKLFRHKHGLHRFEHTPATDDPIRATRPVVVMGVGHSGTSVLAKMLSRLGFYAGEADQEFGEHPGIRELNETAWQTRDLDGVSGWEHLERLARPWVVKDPRFVHTLDLWHTVMSRYEPVLVWVVRRAADVAASYARRGEGYRGGQTLESLHEMAARQFDAWPWAKIRVDFEKIADAVGLFDLARAGIASGAGDPVPPQAEPRVVPSAVYDGVPGGPCVCTGPGDCRRHPAIRKIGRLFEICQGRALTPEKCEVYRRAWDEQAAGGESVVEPATRTIENDRPADCVHRGDKLRTCGSG